MGSGLSVERTVGITSNNTMDVKNKFSHDVKKLTNAAAKLKIASKKKSDKEKEKSEKMITNNRDVIKPAEPIREVQKQVERIPSKKELIYESSRIPRPKPSSEQQVLTRYEKKWTLTDLLHCLGTYVHQQCKGLLSRPTAPEVAMWVRCTDKALHLNGWTINSFLLESHVVFTYMLLQKALKKFEVRSLTDAKELVLMCLYISYTYNANEISYPLRPFLVKQDRVQFWSRCTDLSLDSSRIMLKINQDRTYYNELLHNLKSYCVAYTYH
jgi:hypothetical protein